MNKKLKKGLVVSTFTLLSTMIFPTVTAVAAPVNTNGWDTVNSIQYFYRNGAKVMNQWVQDANGKWCFLSAFDGSVVQEGWAKDSTGWCYIRNGLWVDHATWAKDTSGWQFINTSGYWDSSVAPLAENPLQTADDAVSKAEVSKLQSDMDAAKVLVNALNDGLPEKASLTARLNSVITVFKVDSVSVVNATQVRIEFSYKVDTNTANDTDNYDFGDNLKISKAEVQADGKTVLITFKEGDALSSSSDDGYIVKISGVKNKLGTTIKEYKEVLSLYDSVRPEVESVKLQDGTLKIQFSEPVKSADDSNIEITDEDGNELNITDNVDINLDDASIVEVTGISSEEKSEYTLIIDSGIKDYAGNKVVPYEKTITVEEDVKDPEVESVKSVSLTTLEITFSEPIADDFSLYIDGELADVELTTVNGTNRKSFYAAFDDEQDPDNTFKVMVDDYKDYADNEGDSYTRFVKFSEAGPALESTKASVKTIGGHQYAVFTFDQAVDGSIHSSKITDGTYVDEDGDEVELSDTDLDDLNVYDASVDELEDYLDDDQFAIALRGLKVGDYTLTLGDGFAEVNDAESDEVDVKFSVTEADESDGDEVYIDNLEKVYGTNDRYLIHFSDEVDDSALDTDNYFIDGDNIFSKAIFTSSNKNEVKLTVKQGAIENGEEQKLSSDYKFTTSGITDADGDDVADFDSHDIIDKAYYGDKDGDNFDGILISETTGPAVKKVSMENLDEFTVTFDEEVDNADDIDAEDFQVLVDGDSVDIDDVDNDDGITFTITLDDDIDEDYSKIKIGTSSDFDGEDKYGNDGITNSTKTISAD